MDAFYASIEQRDHPELRGRPVIVGGLSPRGVVSAASYEARVYGVHSAMPTFQARQLCPDATFRSPDMARYAAVSAQIHRIFAGFTSDLEPIALDEAFLEISGSISLFGGAVALARALKHRVREETELAVTVGVGPSKLVAKIACSLSKPDGLLVVPPEAVRWLLDPLPVGRLWGIGPVLTERLAEFGIQRVADLRQCDPDLLRRRFGAHAVGLRALAAGEDARPVESGRAPKSYGEENTFERDLTDRDTVAATLTAHAEAVARRLRADGYRGRVVTLKVKLGRAPGRRAGRSRGSAGPPDYPLLTRRRTLGLPTDDDRTLRDTALALWDQAALREPVRLLGLSVSGLEARSVEQLELFPARSETLGPTLDAIERRFGPGAIRRAVGTPQKLTPSDRKRR